MKTFSLTRRLIGAIVLSQLLLAIALIVVGSYYARYHLRSAFDVNLEGRALSIAALVYYPDDGSHGLLFDATKIPQSAHHIHKDLFVVTSDRGGFEKHSEGYKADFLRGLPDHERYWEFAADGEPYRAIILRNVSILDTEASFPKPLPKLTVVYAAPTMDIYQRLVELATYIGFSSVVLVIPTLMMTVWTIRRTIAPLHQLAHEAKSISVQNWDFKPSQEAKAAIELEPLISAIETVLDGLHRSFRQQHEFLGDAAHELKTAFAILKSSSQSLLNRPRSAEEYRLGLHRMSEDGDRLEGLLDRMLRLARAEQWAAEGVQPTLDVIDLASTCEMAVARIKQFAGDRNICIQLEVVDQLLMRADPADLELVWLNFLENAVHASTPGSSIELCAERRGEAAVIFVSDAGCGISESELPHVFDRFRRGDPSRSRSTGGFGLGLAIAYSIISSYKGSVNAESRVGMGTRITVTLPLEKSLAARSDLNSTSNLFAESSK